MSANTQTKRGYSSASQPLGENSLNVVQYETDVEERSSRASRRAHSRGSDTGNVTSTDVGAVRFEAAPRRPKATKQLDPVLLSRTEELLDDVEYRDPEGMALAIDSLRCVLCELWETASLASQYHQSILTQAEGLVRTAESISQSQAAALRGAIADLGRDDLTETHVEVSRSRFIEEGFNPLAILGNMEYQSDGGGQPPGSAGGE